MNYQLTMLSEFFAAVVLALSTAPSGPPDQTAKEAFAVPPGMIVEFDPSVSKDIM